MAESLIIGGVTINRVTSNISIIRCSPWSKDGMPTFTFTRRGIALETTDPHVGKSFSYTLPSGTLLFAGDVQSVLVHSQNGLGWVKEYTCLGLKKRAEFIPVTDENTKTDTARYNLASDDPYVILSRQGRNVGQIVTDILTMATNSTALAAAGIGNYTGMGPPAVLPASTVADLATLTIVPPFEVPVVGERILETLQGVIQNVHPNHWLNVEPDGTIRVYDPRAFATKTLTLGPADRVDMPQWSRDVSGCYQRVVIRGNQRVQGIPLRLKPWPGSADPDGGLQEDFAHDGLTNTQAKAAWLARDFQSPQTGINTASAIANISGGSVVSLSVVSTGDTYAAAPSVVFSGGGGTGASYTAVLTGQKVTSYTKVSGGTGYFYQPGVIVDSPNVGARDIGTCTCPSTTTVRFTSSHATYHWPSNFWDQTVTGKMGTVYLRADAVAGVSQYWQARITSNTALVAGGTSDLTIDNPLPNTGFTAAIIIGNGTGASLVWRKYKCSNTAIGAALQVHAPYDIPYVAPDGLSAGQTTSPICYVIQGVQYKTVNLTIDPETGHFYLDKPSALVFSGDKVTPVVPDEIEIYAIVANGTLQAVYPADVAGVPQYAGTSNTVEGLTRTKYVTSQNWRDYGNAANMLLWATDLHGALSPAVVEGSVTVARIVTEALSPGYSLLINASYPTGLETEAIPLVSADLDFNEEGAGTSYDMTLHYSSRRAPYSGTIFQRPSQTGSMLGMIGGSLDMSASWSGSPGVSGMEDLSGPTWQGGIVAPDTAGNGLGGGKDATRDSSIDVGNAASLGSPETQGQSQRIIEQQKAADQQRNDAASTARDTLPGLGNQDARDSSRGAITRQEAADASRNQASQKDVETRRNDETSQKNAARQEAAKQQIQRQKDADKARNDEASRRLRDGDE